MTIISKVLPGDVIAAEQVGCFCGDLHAEEQKVLGDAVPKRRMDFIAGRTCARTALELLGSEVSPILRGPNREPLWPADIVGSITHCEGYCAAAVSYKRKYLGIGIDAEINQALPDGIIDIVSLPEERQLLDQLLPRNRNWDRLLFSIKESVYKVWFPIQGSWLGFEDVIVKIDPSISAFEAYVQRVPLRDGSAAFSILRGRYFFGEHILTAIALPAG